jgi:subtilisin
LSAQTLSTEIDRTDGDLSSARSGNRSGEVDIAVIDTGIDLDHRDLNARSASTA